MRHLYIVFYSNIIEMEYRFSFTIQNVEGDGHCFFRSVVQALRFEQNSVQALRFEQNSVQALRFEQNSVQDTENVQVIKFRQELAKLALKRHRKTVQKMIDETIALCYQPGIDCFLSGTPIDSVVTRDREYSLEHYARVLADTNAFASFIEVEIARKMLKRQR